MKPSGEMIICRLKAARKAKGLSQSELAGLVGVKRQAIYDMESGRYVPNTALALRLARHLGRSVEELFEIRESAPPAAADSQGTCNPRVSVVRVRERLIAHPLDGRGMLSEDIRAADGLLLADGSVRLLREGDHVEKKALLLGCDPAFSVLSSHVSHRSGSARLQCRFASSYRALEELRAGRAHVAAIHMHDGFKPNVELAREVLSGSKCLVVAFSFFEEGLMVAPGNPRGIRTVADLAAKGVRFVNRERGAALRVLLDTLLDGFGIPEGAVAGYSRIVSSHAEGAQTVAFDLADAALGLRVVAAAYGLDFVPLESVRCDMVIPSDFLEHPAVRTMLDELQTKRLREDLASLPGYESSCTGEIIAEI